MGHRHIYSAFFYCFTEFCIPLLFISVIAPISAVEYDRNSVLL